MTCIVVVCKTISSLDSIIKEPLEQFKLMEEALKKASSEQKLPVGYAVALAQILKKRKERKRKKP